jgi:hypothetical protein
LHSHVVSVQDAAEPYTVEIAIQLRGAPEEGQARRWRRPARANTHRFAFGLFSF